jgi:acetolactate synthase-1/2/3 large subunit
MSSRAREAEAAARPRVRTADVLVAALTREGVTHIFGHPGGAVLPLYDALSGSGIAHLLMRHEQGAAHAAQGFARATGRVGMCLATSGPGATNLITGLTDAMMDSTPVFALTAQVVSALIGRDGFQEADVIGLTQPVTKHNWLVLHAEDVPETISRAFALARGGRPGPVLVDIPRDVLQREIEAGEEDLRELAPFPRRANATALRRAALAITNARRPVLYGGGGVISANASGELQRLAKKTRIPVTTTLMGKGAFPETDPQSLGMLGMHGTATANYAMNESDLIIALGARFDDRITGKLATFAPHAKVVHLDIDEAEIGKIRKADFPLQGDARAVLNDLLPLVGAPDTKAWWARIEEWKAKYPLRYRQEGDVILPQFAIDRLYQLTKGRRPIVTTDVGQHQMWAAQFFLCDEPRTFITSGGLGTMGFGLPAAIGAQCGHPDRLVLNINGDGSFQQTMQALATAVEERLPIKIVILNNGSLGMVRQWQDLFYDKRFFATALRNPDFAKLAEAFGAAGFTVRRPEDLDATYREALAVTDRPAVVNVFTAEDENCYPMWPAGQSIDTMIIEDPKYRRSET